MKKTFGLILAALFLAGIGASVAGFGASSAPSGHAGAGGSHAAVPKAAPTPANIWG